MATGCRYFNSSASSDRMCLPEPGMPEIAISSRFDRGVALYLSATSLVESRRGLPFSWAAARTPDSINQSIHLSLHLLDRDLSTGRVPRRVVVGYLGLLQSWGEQRGAGSTDHVWSITG